MRTWPSIPREDNTWYNLQLEHYSKKTYGLKNKYIAVFFTDWIYFANNGWNFCTVNNFNNLSNHWFILLYMIMIHYTFCLKVKEDLNNNMASIIYSKVGSTQFQGRWKIYDSVCLEPQLMFQKEKPQTCQYFFFSTRCKTCLLTHYVTL